MRSLVKRAALAADRLLPTPSGVVTLIYHRVGGGTDSSIDLPIAEFDRQMAWLSANRTVVSLQTAVGAVRRGDHRIDGSVVVTFDDGTADFCDHAVPVLLEHGVPATLFAETSPISTGNRMASGLAPTSWSALRDAVATGLVTVESHTHTHRVLRDVDAASAADELDRSIDAISTELGIPPRHFAYPKAVAGSTDARAEVAARFESAAIGGGRPMKAGGDVQAWPRTPVQRTDSFEMFQRKAQGGMWLEGVARSAAAQVRYQGVDR